jgi:hypothetical protein
VVAALFVAVSVVVQAIRQDSWGPISMYGWLPAVIVATLPATNRRCWPRRRRAAE